MIHRTYIANGSSYSDLTLRDDPKTEIDEMLGRVDPRLDWRYCLGENR